MSGITRRPRIQAHIIKAHAPEPVTKTENATHLSERKAAAASTWLTPPADLRGFKAMVNHSSILPQCIRAYKNNIAGFGIGIRYKEDYENETSEMKAEFTKAEEIIDLLNMDMDTKEVFEDVIESREIYGIGYLEVIRNAANEVTGIDFIEDTPSIQKTIPLEPYVDIEYNYKNRIEIRPKKFRKYRQQVGSKTMYFKEIGDPRVMDRRTGEYLNGGESLELDFQRMKYWSLQLEQSHMVKCVGLVRYLA